MNQIKKIQPKSNTDIDLDMLAQRIREGSKSVISEATALEPTPTTVKILEKKRTITKNEQPEVVLDKKKVGRKKQNIDEMHRFAIDLPLWLFEKIKIDADDNYSTVRGQIIKLLLANYKK
jgi:hypothetical protein